MRGRRGKGILLAGLLAIALAGAAWVAAHPADLGRLRDVVDGLAAWRAERPATLWLALWALYVAATALSVPVAVWLTLAAGALFGFVGGLALVLTAAPLGATLSFLAARWIARDKVRGWLGPRAARIEEALARDGAFALFSLRLVPIVPFWLLNLAMGLTPLPVWTFLWVSILGMAPGSAVYVGAGTQLPRLTSLSGLLSLPVLLAFAALAVLPWVARWILRRIEARRALRGIARPRSYDRNLIVIGGGAAGLVAAYVAAAGKARVTLIERDRMGGECLNTGCVPSKALIRAARVAHEVRQAGQFGIGAGAPTVDFAAVFATIRDRIAAIAPHDSVERYQGLGVEVLQGDARLADPWTVEVTDPGGAVTRLTTRSIVLATGAEPAVPDIPGLRDLPFLTSETLWDAMAARVRADGAPGRLAILGGGAVGVELAQAFARLGVRVTLIEAADRLLPRSDPDLSEAARQALEADGVDLRLGSSARACGSGPSGQWIELADGARVDCDELVVAIGRRPRLGGLGLEALGLLDKGRLVLDQGLATRLPHILAAGDVAGPVQLTHAAGHQGTVAALNGLFGFLWRVRGDRPLLPQVVFADPELAQVGLTETEAAATGIAVDVTRVDLADNDRAICEGLSTPPGFVKILTAKGKGRILGAAIVAPGAGEMVGEVTLAIRKGLGMADVLSTIHPYPTMGEGLRMAAGRWRSGRVPPRVQAVLDKLHRFRRKEPR